MISESSASNSGKRVADTRYRYWSGIILALFIVSAFVAMFINSRQVGRREEERKVEVLENIAEAIAPSVRSYFEEMAEVLLDDFVERENHPYLVIHHSDGEVFYYHREPVDPNAPGFRLGMLRIRSLELPVLHEDFPIAVIRTDYVSSEALSELVRTLFLGMGITLAVLIRRTFIAGMDRKAALERLRDAQDQLVLNDRSVFFSQLAARLAHEFNTPLGVIITAQSFLAELDNEGLGSEDGRSMLGLIGSSAATIKALIQRMQNSIPGTGNEKPGSVDIGDLIRSRFELIWRDGDTLELGVDGEPVWAARQDILGLIVAELMENASRHGRAPDGRLSLSVRNDRDNREYRLFIRDSGPGIPEELRTAVFSPFTTASAMKEGSGLGLYLARNYATQYLKGGIELAGSPEGAVFVLTVPIAESRTGTLSD